jgi:hypothetical protein
MIFINGITFNNKTYQKFNDIIAILITVLFSKYLGCSPIIQIQTIMSKFYNNAH